MHVHPHPLTFSTIPSFLSSVLVTCFAVLTQIKEKLGRERFTFEDPFTLVEGVPVTSVKLLLEAQ